MLGAGVFRHQVTIQENIGSQNESGEIVQCWAVKNRVRAAISPLSGRELMTAEQVQSEITHKVIIRFLAEVTAKQRLIFGARVFEIVSVINPNEANRTLELLCKEVTGKSYTPEVVVVTDVVFATGFMLATWTITFSRPIVHMPDTVAGWLALGFVVDSGDISDGKIVLTRNGMFIWPPPSTPKVVTYDGSDGVLVADNGYNIETVNYTYG